MGAAGPGVPVVGGRGAGPSSRRSRWWRASARRSPA